MRVDRALVPSFDRTRLFKTRTGDIEQKRREKKEAGEPQNEKEKRGGKKGMREKIRY